MNTLKQGWFSEISDLWPGISQSLEVKKILYIGQSTYFSFTNTYGRTLVLDGIIQCTEKDEFCYQEMISFLPLCSHPNPRSVLIVGGGDGGVAREVAKFPSDEKIIQIEIDEKVIEISKILLPFMAKGLTNSKVNLYVGNGYEFVKQCTNEFDVIITDSSDPIGAAVTLFKKSYFLAMKNALKPNGIICSQIGTVWSDIYHIKNIIHHCKASFPNVRYGISYVPSYPTGQIGYVLGGLNSENIFQEPRKLFSNDELNKMNLRYYNHRIHRTCFELPRFIKKEIYFNHP